MKLLLLSTLFAFGAASASELLRLPVPVQVTEGTSPYRECATTGFNADGSVAGTCRVALAYPCSGRGCQPVRYTYTYVASWGLDGYSIGATECSIIRRHFPQPATVTYLNGYTADTCPLINFNPTGTVVVIDGVPYAYVSTDALGDEVVNSNYAGYLYLP